MESNPQPQGNAQSFSSLPKPPFLNKSVVVGIATLAIISLGATAYLLFLPKQKEEPAPPPMAYTKPLIKPTVIPTQANTVSSVAGVLPTSTSVASAGSQITVTKSASTPAIDPFASWNVYNNPRYGYSIKYPKDWTVKNYGQIEPKVIDYIVFNPSTASSSAKTVSISYSTRTYDEAMEIGATTSESITVDGVKGAKKSEQDSGGNVTQHIILPLNSKLNTIVIYAQDKYKDTFTQMLSTFKFN